MLKLRQKVLRIFKTNHFLESKVRVHSCGSQEFRGKNTDTGDCLSLWGFTELVVVDHFLLPIVTFFSFVYRDHFFGLFLKVGYCRQVNGLYFPIYILQLICKLILIILLLFLFQSGIIFIPHNLLKVFLQYPPNKYMEYLEILY